MAYTLIAPHVRFSDYRPPEVKVDCSRCQRNVSLHADKLRGRYGDIPVIEAARRLAAVGRKPCGLAMVEGGRHCGVRAMEPPVWHWANLYQALHGKWQAELFCRRHLEALKRATPCPGSIVLDVPTMAATLGHEFKLERLPGKCECPKCHTELVDIIWHIPDPMAPTHAPAAVAPVLQLRPSRSQIARRTLRVIGGRNA